MAPVGEVEEALVVEVADIPDRAPAVPAGGLGSLLGIVEVLELDVGLEVDLTRLARGQLVAVLVEDVDRSVSARPTEPGGSASPRP